MPEIVADQEARLEVMDLLEIREDNVAGNAVVEEGKAEADLEPLPPADQIARPPHGLDQI